MEEKVVGSEDNYWFLTVVFRYTSMQSNVFFWENLNGTFFLLLEHGGNDGNFTPWK